MQQITQHSGYNSTTVLNLPGNQPESKEAFINLVRKCIKVKVNVN